MMFNKYKNKKGVLGQMLALGLGLLLLIDILFFSFFIYQDVQTEVLAEFNNVSQQLNQSATTVAGTQYILDSFSLIDFKLDVIVLLVFMTYTFSSLGLSWFSPPLPRWNVWSLLTIGNLFFMMMYTIVDQIRSYFYNDVLIFLYGGEVVTQTGVIYQWFSNNYAFFIVGLMVGCVVLNQFANKPQIDDFEVIE